MRRSRTAPDLILFGGLVRTLSESQPTAEAVACRDGQIVAVGGNREVLDLATAGTETLHLEGSVVVPAFTDSHTHYHRASVLRAHFLDFEEIAPRRMDDVLSAVAERSVSFQPGLWIQGDNLRASDLDEGVLPTRHLLDAAAPQHPVILRGTGKHVVVANSLALANAGIDRNTEDPPGGRIERDAEGEPTGVLHERAKLRLDANRADTVVPPIALEDRLNALRDGIARLHRHGIGGIHEIVRDPVELSDYLQLRERGQLDARVNFYIRAFEARTELDHILEMGLRSGLGDEWARLAGIKVSIDGDLTLRNAAIYDPYPDQPDNRGILRIDPDVLSTLVGNAHRAGLQVAVHANGPRAVDIALDAFESATKADPTWQRRHRIEHAFLPPRVGQLERFVALGLILSTQPGFLAEEGEQWPGLLGWDDAAFAAAVPLQSALNAGLHVLINSDYPCAALDPLFTLKAAVTRRTVRGATLGSEERVDVQSAIAMMTREPAYAVFQESRSGSIEPGKLADMVALSRDPWQVQTEEDWAALAVVRTVVGGRLVYQTND